MFVELAESAGETFTFYLLLTLFFRAVMISHFTENETCFDKYLRRCHNPLNLSHSWYSPSKTPVEGTELDSVIKHQEKTGKVSFVSRGKKFKHADPISVWFIQTKRQLSVWHYKHEQMEVEGDFLLFKWRQIVL